MRSASIPATSMATWRTSCRTALSIGGNGIANGREEIRRWVGGLMAGGRIGGTPAMTRHFVGLPYVTGTGDGRAEARTYVIIFTLTEAGRVWVPSVGSYKDTVVKMPEGWLFAR